MPSFFNDASYRAEFHLFMKGLTFLGNSFLRLSFFITLLASVSLLLIGWTSLLSAGLVFGALLNAISLTPQVAMALGIISTSTLLLGRSHYKKSSTAALPKNEMNQALLDNEDSSSALTSTSKSAMPDLEQPSASTTSENTPLYQKALKAMPALPYIDRTARMPDESTSTSANNNAAQASNISVEDALKEKANHLNVTIWDRGNKAGGCFFEAIFHQAMLKARYEDYQQILRIFKGNNINSYIDLAKRAHQHIYDNWDYYLPFMNEETQQREHFNPENYNERTMWADNPAISATATILEANIMFVPHNDAYKEPIVPGHGTNGFWQTGFTPPWQNDKPWFLLGYLEDTHHVALDGKCNDEISAMAKEHDLVRKKSIKCGG